MFHIYFQHIYLETNWDKRLSKIQWNWVQYLNIKPFSFFLLATKNLKNNIYVQAWNWYISSFLKETDLLLLYRKIYVDNGIGERCCIWIRRFTTTFPEILISLDAIIHICKLVYAGTNCREGKVLYNLPRISGTFLIAHQINYDCVLRLPNTS